MTTPPVQPRPTLAWVAWIRLIATVGVISIHNAGTNAVAGRKGTGGTAGIVGVLVDIPFIVAVPMFVMVSGALTLNPASFRGTGHYLRKRVLRTVPAIVFWHAAYVAFLQLYWYPKPLPAEVIVGRILSGRLVPHLYFLWIVLGLSLLAPVLVRWLKEASRTEQLWVGGVLAAVPALTVATRTLRGSPTLAVETPWTWWVYYLGLFVLGWALRDVVLRGVALLAAAAVGLALPALFCFQYLHPTALPRLGQIAPVTYYGATVIVASICLFLVARATIRDGGLLAPLATPAVMRLVNPVATASLGIYAVHVMILWTITRVGPWGADVLPSADLMLRLLLVTVLATVVTLVARRIPGIRQVF